jgi:hypothetical protein
MSAALAREDLDRALRAFAEVTTLTADPERASARDGLRRRMRQSPAFPSPDAASSTPRRELMPMTDDVAERVLPRSHETADRVP